MKIRLFIVVLGVVLSFLPLVVLGGQKEGNGGGAWACKGQNNGVEDIEWITLVDLYEGRQEFHLNIPVNNTADYRQLIEARKQLLLSLDQEFGTVISQYVDEILNALVFMDADLRIIDDALYRIQPSRRECSSDTLGAPHIEYVQLANFTHYNKTLIQETAWNSEKFSHTDRAALIFHEAIYKYLREKKGDTDSVRTRMAVAYLFADINERALKEKLIELEFFCTNPQPDPETRTTTTGAVFTRDTSHGRLNEAWRDPDGLIWGDIVKKTDGTVHYMNHAGATNYCISIGARLPSIEEFTRLREYMGAQPGSHWGYSPQILPNLSGHGFWSLSVLPNNADFAFGFSGYTGEVGPFRRDTHTQARCVVGR